MAVRSHLRHSRGNGLPILMVSMTLAIFGLVVAVMTLELRSQIRRQILHRESEALYSATILQRDLLQESGSGLEIGEDRFDLFAIVLRTSRMRGVVAVRLFDSDGRFYDSVPVAVDDDDLPDEVVRQVTTSGPRSVFHQAFPLDQLFLAAGDHSATAGSSLVPLLEVVIPLSRVDDESGSGLAQYWIDGSSIQEEFARLDRSLAWQGGLAFAAGAVLSLLGLGWAFTRLERANRLLQKRGADLARANADLLLAAKTSAIGTVASHLMHGLKNPLAGLESLVVSSGPDSSSPSQDSLREAAAAAKRLRQMVDEVVMILGEEKSTVRYELPVSEVLDLVAARVKAKVDARSVTFSSRGGEQALLSNREANLVGLILVNLIENAIEASAEGGAVTLEALVYETEIEFLVEDRGPGIPESVRDHLFQPVRSTKEGGSGIGLALSHQLAVSLGGRLELDECPGGVGAQFKLTIPLTVLAV